MSDIMTSVDDHLREALRILRLEHDARLAAFEKEVSLLQQRINSLETMLSSDGDDTGSPRLAEFSNWMKRNNSSAANPILHNTAQQLRGKTHPEALIQIAQAEGGILRTAPAKATLIEAGLVKGNPKNVLGHIFQLLKDSDRFAKLGYRFEKIEPGVYRLLPLRSSSTGNGEDVDDDTSQPNGVSVSTRQGSLPYEKADGLSFGQK